MSFQISKDYHERNMKELQNQNYYFSQNESSFKERINILEIENQQFKQEFKKKEERN
jgi:hypothetical protein